MDMAERLRVTADTVRYYTRIGYLSPRKNPSNGYREYSEKDYIRLRFIVSARQLGFSVDDIGEILAVADKGKTPCPLVRRLIEQRLGHTENQFLQTVDLHNRMRAAVEKWKGKPDKEPTGHMICHLIEGFTKHPTVENRP